MLAVLAISSALDVVAGALFAFVGRALARRPVEPHARPAARMFEAWWFALAGVVAVGGFALNGGALGLAAAAWGPDALASSGTLYAFLVLWILLACVAVWGIIGHLVYLFRGARVGRLLAWAYAGLFLVFAAVAWWEHPAGLELSSLGVRVVYERPVTGAFLVVLLLFLEAPQIGSALAYGTLLRVARSRATRFRVLVVSGALSGWFLLAFLAAAFEVATQDPWILTLRVVALASAVLVLTAYAPPRRLHAWLDRSPEEEARKRDVQRKALHERVMRLV